MAPTEILARQHLKTIAPLADAAGLRVAILTGRERGACAQGNPRPADARRHRSADRHPRAVSGGRRLPRSRAGDRRRTAPLRRASAAGADAEGRRGRRAGAHRHADPAHAGADLFRRHGHLRIAREAARPPADRHPHHSALAQRGSRGRGRPRIGCRQSAPIGSARWSRNRKRSIWPPAKRATRSCARNSASASIWCTAA